MCDIKVVIACITIAESSLWTIQHQIVSTFQYGHCPDCILHDCIREQWCVYYRHPLILEMKRRKGAEKGAWVGGGGARLSLSLSLIVFGWEIPLL